MQVYEFAKSNLIVLGSNLMKICEFAKSNLIILKSKFDETLRIFKIKFDNLKPNLIIQKSKE
ncbi:MAG: hypothetical protein K5978_03900 [Campylobacter sp.]|nr:hypothetical protein [Campylobacter sp.]